MDSLNFDEKILLKQSVQDLIRLNSNIDQVISTVKELAARLEATWGWEVIMENIKDLSPEEVKFHFGI